RARAGAHVRQPRRVGASRADRLRSPSGGIPALPKADRQRRPPPITAVIRVILSSAALAGLVRFMACPGADGGRQTGSRGGSTRGVAGGRVARGERGGCRGTGGSG